MSEQIELGGHVYVCGRLNAMEQFHVSRKLAPVLPTLVPLLANAANVASVGAAMTGGAVDPAQAKELAESTRPFAEALAEMSDENANFIVKTCLSVVKRQGQGAWFAVVRNGEGMYDDMDIGVILPLVVRVITGSLGGFIKGLVTSVTGASPE